MFNLEEVRRDQKKRTVSVFIVDKRSKKIVKPAKDMVLRLFIQSGISVLPARHDDDDDDDDDDIIKKKL